MVGSGIGGLTAGATLAKAGKKVLVLEQHDQAGGCCHTYIEKGFEFDVGKICSHWSLLAPGTGARFVFQSVNYLLRSLNAVLREKMMIGNKPKTLLQRSTFRVSTPISYGLRNTRIFTTSLAVSSTGLHYIGQLHENSLLRIAFDQLSEGQLEFQQLKQHFDTVHIGLDDHRRAYTILSGKTEMKDHLKKQFPEDTEAIEAFFKIMKVPS